MTLKSQQVRLLLLFCIRINNQGLYLLTRRTVRTEFSEVLLERLDLWLFTAQGWFLAWLYLYSPSSNASARILLPFIPKHRLYKCKEGVILTDRVFKLLGLWKVKDFLFFSLTPSPKGLAKLLRSRNDCTSVAFSFYNSCRILWDKIIQ